MSRIDKKQKEDPALSFSFALEIKGIIEGFFTECTGLQSEREIEEYKEGGENDFIHKLPGRLKYANVVLKRGVVDSDELWKWYEKGHNDGQVNRKDVTIKLFNTKGETLKSWNLEDAYPAKWSGPDLKAASNDVAIESIELAHHGLKLVK